jgi:hypothetical protein
MHTSIQSYEKLQSQYEEFMATSPTEVGTVESGKKLLTKIRSTGRYTTDPVTRELYAQMARDVGERLRETTGGYFPVRLEALQVLGSTPFVYGRPVRPDEFVGRDHELRTIFNRLRNCESTAVVGEPHIGKTSLLLKLTDERTQKIHFGDDAQRLLVNLLDLHYIGNDYTPAAFWADALYTLCKHSDYSSTSAITRLEQPAQTGYTPRHLELLFKRLADDGQQLVLLLDEFERLLVHPNFQDPTFFGLLRSLATRTGGLAFVIASRLSVAEMNERGQVLQAVTGSPFFNNMVNMPLGPFDERSAEKLLDQAGDALSPGDRRFVRRVAGRHPFLLQAMAATLLETSGDDRWACAAERFYEQIAFHFDDLWRALDDRTRTTAVILCLIELGGRAVGREFSCGEIERVDAFGPELRKLAKRGLAEQVGEGSQFDYDHLLLWQEERWTVGAQAFAWWVRDVVVTGIHQVPAYDEWLDNRAYRFLVTQEQWDRLVNAVRGAPGWALRDVGGLAQALFEELVQEEDGDGSTE